MELLMPKELELTSDDGRTLTYVLSKIPAIPCREIACKYPLSGLPKLGDYAVNEETMLKLMGYVGIKTPEGGTLRLSTAALVNNHVPDLSVLMKLEWEMLTYNVSFLKSAGSSTFLETIVAKARPFAMKMLTELLAQSSPKAKPRSTN